MRQYIRGNVSIDGRNIPYTLVTATDYLSAKYDFSEEDLEKFWEENEEICSIISQIMATLHSHWLLRRVSYSCGSLSDAMYDLRHKLIRELKDKYNFEFDAKMIYEQYFEGTDI